MEFFVIIEVVSLLSVGIVLMRTAVRNAHEQCLKNIYSDTEGLALAFSE